MTTPRTARGDATLRRLEKLARVIRYQTLAMSTAAGSGHPTSSLSAVDLMTVLWFDGWFRFDPDRPDHPNNDRLIFSKGHASPLFYALWFAAGRLSAEELRGYRTFNSPLEGHPTSAFPLVDAATGSLGQGLAIGAGYALNGRYLDRMPYRTFVLLGDSEMTEGSQWEAVQLAAHYRLGSLIGILDANRLGQRGATMLGHDLKAYARRLGAFGWRTMIVDGHSMRSIRAAYSKIDRTPDTPTMIIARTVKGKGVAHLEDQEGWHGKALDAEEFAEAVQGLGEIDHALRGQLTPPEDRIPAIPTPAASAPPEYQRGVKMATREAYGRALCRIARQFPEVVALDSEVGNSTKAGLFASAQPHRFFETFIAEQCMVGMATGLSRRGKVPFVSTFAAFLTRAFDQIRMAPYSNANIKFVGSHAGVSIGADGPSQMGLEDIAMFRSVPGCVVLHPCDAVATDKLVEAAARHRGLVYLRTLRQATPVIYEAGEEFPFGGSKTLRQHPKDVATIVAAGATVHEALKAADELAARGQPVEVIDLYCIAPIDKINLAEAAARTRLVLTVEDHHAAGGLGEAVKSALAPLPVPVFSLAVEQRPHSGRPEELRDFERISAPAIIQTLEIALGATPDTGDTTTAAAEDTSTDTAPPPPIRSMNPLRQLHDLGQSVWLDFLSRDLLRRDALQRLIHEDGLSGITSNPAIFDQAIAESDDYDEAIRHAAAEIGGDDVEAIFERLAIADIREAADQLQSVYLASNRRDGYVSLEVSPQLAHDTEGSTRQARQLWQMVSRPNLLVKIPGTAEGLPAIQELLADGINVNVTLLFSLTRYDEVIEAFLAGLEQGRRHNNAARHVTSVASFFLSRIDAKVDPRLDEIAHSGGELAARARQLRGRVAIACARLAYQKYCEVFEGDRFADLRTMGLQPQRLLWASTSTKDPDYPDTKYVEALIGRDTINTMPLHTLEAYRDHGDPHPRLIDGLKDARATLDALPELGIDLDAITRELETEGVEKFAKPYRHMLEHLAAKLEHVAT